MPHTADGLAHGERRDTGLLAAGLAVTILAYGASWRRFPGLWTGDRTHGFAIALLCGWLLWRDRALLTPRGEPVRWAIALVGAASMVWMVAMAMSVQAVHLLMAPALLIAWVFAATGAPTGRAALRIGAFFMLAMPLWEALLGPLQWLTVLVNRSLIAVTGLPAEVSGTAIKFAAGTLVVAYSCAGLNFLMAGLTLGAAYAGLFVKDGRTQLKIVGLSAAVAILSNWLRVFGLVVIAYVTDMQSSLMQDHVVYGWLVFALSLPVFFLGAGRLERSAPVTGPTASDAGHDTAPAMTVTAAPGGPARQPIVLLATVAALLGPAILYGVQSVPPALAVTPKASGIAWSVVQPVTPPGDGARWQAGFRHAGDRRSEFVSSEGKIVQIDRFIYGPQRQGAEMVSYENRVADDSLTLGEGNVGPLDEQARIVREAYVRQGTGVRVVWYWYRTAGVETASPVRAKLLELLAFFSRREASEIVVLSTMCTEPTCVSSRNALFLAASGRPFTPAARDR